MQKELGFQTLNFKLLQLSSNVSLLIKMGTITINTFLQTRNKFFYSCSIKIRAFGIRRTLGQHFLHPAGCGSVFPAKSCRGAWRSGSQLARGQVNTKLCNPICSTFEALVVRLVVGHCHGEEPGPFCWPILAVGTAVFCASHWFAELTFSDVMVPLGFRKL